MHEQAFHTSCRSGLSKQPGFQFNARSAGLDDASLMELAAELAGYHAPRDLPPEPAPDQISLFPVALSYRKVGGTGVALARTAYVGREFRGRDGEPDSGRFGNYFSHIIVPSPNGEPFDGLRPIELWDAPHWVEVESAIPELPTLTALEPGPLSLEAALDELLHPPRNQWIAAVLSATMEALGGGPRVVLVDQPGRWAASWVTLISSALPRRFVPDFTFMTYDGRPRSSTAVLCVTTPGCDVRFQPHELAHSVCLIDVQDGNASAVEPGLFGRCVEHTASCGEAAGIVELTRGVEALFPDTEPGALDAGFAVIVGEPDIVADDEIVAVLEAALSVTDPMSELTAATLPNFIEALGTRAAEGVGVERPSAWVRLHRTARESRGDIAESIAGAALRVLASCADEAALEGFEPVPPNSPTAPPPIALAAWLQLLDPSSSPAELAQRVDASRRLGLLGINTELDRRIGGALAGHAHEPVALELLVALLTESETADLAQESLHSLAARAAEDDPAYAALQELYRRPESRTAIEQAARAPEGFDLKLALARAEAVSDHGARPRLTAALLSAASGDEQRSRVITALYGPEEDWTVEGAGEVLRAHARAQIKVPLSMIAKSWHLLDQTSLRDAGAPAVARLLSGLRAADRAATGRPTHNAMALARQANGQKPLSPREWLSRAEGLLASPQQLVPLHRRELAQLAIGRIVHERDPREYHARYFALHRQLGRSLEPLYERALQTVADRDPGSPTVAVAFRVWREDGRSAGGYGSVFLRKVLPELVATWSERHRSAVASHLPASAAKAWLRWCEEHPAPRAVNRMTRRMRRRRG